MRKYLWSMTILVMLFVVMLSPMQSVRIRDISEEIGITPGGISQQVETLVRCRVVCPYADYAKIESVLSSFRVRKEAQTFESDVTTVFLLPAPDEEKASRALTEATNGRIALQAEEQLYGVL